MAERRTQKRYTVSLPLFISIEGTVYQRPVRLRSKDVSEGGLSFETRARIPIDSNSRVHVSSLGDLPPEARIEGRVVYRKKNREKRRYIIGISFDRFVEVTAEELAARLERWEQRPEPQKATHPPA